MQRVQQLGRKHQRRRRLHHLEQWALLQNEAEIVVREALVGRDRRLRVRLGEVNFEFSQPVGVGGRRAACEKGQLAALRLLLAD